MTATRVTTAALAVLTAASLAACGSTTKPRHTAHVAAITDGTIQQCLESALYQQEPTNCGPNAAVRQLERIPDTKVAVVCTHEQANEYTCTATGYDAGTYQATYDGHTFSYQQTS